MARARLEATIGLRSGAFRRGLGRVVRSARNARRGISGAFRFGKGLALGLLAASAAIAGAMGRVVKSAVAQRVGLAKLSAVLKATGFASGLTTSQLDDQAQALSKLTGISKENINQTQAVLATFKNIKGDEFEKATEAILDMSVVLDQDAKQGAIQLGKALNDPIKGITALSRVGVSFTEQQKEQIKTLAQSGQLQEAQAIILKELQTEFGGAAAAVNEIDGGLANLQESFKQAIGRFGEGVVTSDLFRDSVKSMTDAIDRLIEGGDIQLWAENTIAAVKSIMPFLDRLGEGFGFIRSGIQKVSAFAGGFVGTQGTFKERIAAGKGAANTIGEELEKDRQKRLAQIRQDREKRRKERDEREKKLFRKQGAEQGAVAPPTEKERFSSLRRIGANLISGAQPIEKKKMSLMERQLKLSKERNDLLKKRVSIRGVF